MKALEERILKYLGRQEYTDPEELIAYFSMSPIDDMVNAINALIANGEMKGVFLDGEPAYTRTMKGYTRLHPIQSGELDDIPF